MTSLLFLLLQASPPTVPPPPPTAGEVQAIVDELKKKAGERGQADLRKAEELQERAELAIGEGRYADAAPLLRQAVALNPNSATLRRWLRVCEQRTQEASDRAGQLRQARGLIDEALGHASRLQAKDAEAAKAWADAILAELNRFPADFDVSAQRQEATALLAPGSDRGELPKAAPNPPPPPADAKTLLKKRLNVSWVQLPLTEALAELADQTGITFIIDPPLARLRWFESRTITYSGEDITAEKLLREILDVAAMESVPGRKAQVLLTTKQQALQFAVAQGQDPRERRPAAPPPVQAVPPSGKREAAPAVPAHLQSIGAFVKALRDALGAEATPAPPARPRDDRPPPLPPE